MPQVSYRKWEHAICGQNKYGYYETLTYINAKTKEPLQAVTGLGLAEWPITLSVQVVIHNHEDLEFFTDGVLNLYDSLRGEHGEDEVISPSALKPSFV